MPSYSTHTDISYITRRGRLPAPFSPFLGPFSQGKQPRQTEDKHGSGNLEIIITLLGDLKACTMMHQVTAALAPHNMCLQSRL